MAFPSNIPFLQTAKHQIPNLPPACTNPAAPSQTEHPCDPTHPPHPSPTLDPPHIMMNAVPVFFPHLIVTAPPGAPTRAAPAPAPATGAAASRRPLISPAPCPASDAAAIPAASPPAAAAPNCPLFTLAEAAGAVVEATATGARSEESEATGALFEVSKAPGTTFEDPKAPGARFEDSEEAAAVAAPLMMMSPEIVSGASSSSTPPSGASVTQSPEVRLAVRSPQMAAIWAPLPVALMRVGLGVSLMSCCQGWGFILGGGGLRRGVGQRGPCVWFEWAGGHFDWRTWGVG